MVVWGSMLTLWCHSVPSFSFGVVLWELCALETPFDGQSMVHIGMQVAVKKVRLPIPDFASDAADDLEERARALSSPLKRPGSSGAGAGAGAASGAPTRAASIADFHGAADDTGEGSWPRFLVTLMRACWRHDPAQRPSFNRICDALATQSEEELARMLLL